VGSQLSTGALSADKARGLRDVDGITLDEAMRRQGRHPEDLGPDPQLTERIGVFVELHVEQGRALDVVNQPIALASAIWPHGRWHLTFSGEANHAGTTRLADRHDPMLAFASSVRAARSLAAAADAVATFGKVIVAPNGANAIPSSVQAWLDARAGDEMALHSLVMKIIAKARKYAAADGIELGVSAESVTPIVEFPQAPRERLQRALARLGDIPVLPTQAGHDAGILSAKVPTAMLFVRNPTGISHSPEEYARPDDCNLGAEALADVMAEWVA
jgi:N-carbamoyl-L-amino-acid hydrolase